MQKASAAKMAREKADSAAGQNGSLPDTPAFNGSGVCRTTAVFPLALNENWEAFALKSGVPKNEVLIAALRQYLINEGLQPDRRPRLEVSY
jgi:hypothetical protein